MRKLLALMCSAVLALAALAGCGSSKKSTTSSTTAATPTVSADPAIAAQVPAKIKAKGVKAVFSETSLPAKTADAIGREAGVKVVAGEDALYGDSLGPPGSAGATYLDMERHNTKEIVDNLR